MWEYRILFRISQVTDFNEGMYVYVCAFWRELSLWPGSEEIAISLRPDARVCVVHNIPSCRKGGRLGFNSVWYESVNECH